MPVVNKKNNLLSVSTIPYSCNLLNINDHCVKASDVMPVIFTRGLILSFPLTKLVDTQVLLN